MGALFKAAAFAHPVARRAARISRASACCRPPRSSTLARIRHGFFTRSGGVSHGVYASLNGGVGSNDAPDKVAENRARMAAALGVAPDRLLTAYQIHSPDVVVADQPWTLENRPRADAIVTRTPRLAIGVSTADCGPLLLADAEAGVIGAAHAGWRGALTGVIEAAIAAMEKLGAERARIVAALGPAIRQPNYEVGPEFVARFLAADADNARFFAAVGARRPRHVRSRRLHRRPRATRRHCDISRTSALCTYAEPERFFSYRRTTKQGEPDYGRHINAIALAD